MKTVFSNSRELIHVFAQRTQSNGRASNVFFESGDKLYSYGHHYLLAEFIKNEQGEEAIMINNSGYSVTTSKHISEVRQGTRQYKQFFTTETSPKHVLFRLEQLVYSLQKARKPEMYIDSAKYIFDKYQEFIAWNGPNNDLVSDAKINALMSVFNGASYADYMAEQAERIKEAEKKKQEEQVKRQKIALKKFFAYEVNSVYGTMEEDFCRISKDYLFVETTQGVRVPIASAKVLYQMIKAKRDIKGFDLCGYTVIGLNGVLRIGCHRINKNNMKKIGEKLLTL